MSLLTRLFGALIALAASMAVGYFGFQAYLKWLESGKTGADQYDPYR